MLVREIEPAREPLLHHEGTPGDLFGSDRRVRAVCFSARDDRTQEGALPMQW